MAHPLTIIARALGVEAGERGTPCALCGDSPFPTFGSRRKTLGRNFTDFESLRYEVDAICQGCRRIMAGRPGDDPPPLRTRSFRVDCSTETLTILPDPLALWAAMQQKPEHPIIISWATSRKKHHALYAGISVNGQWDIGSDYGPIRWRHHSELVAAVEDLRRIGATKPAILTGRYPPRLINRYGQRFASAEAVLESVRGSLHLDLLVNVAPTFPKDNQEVKGEGRMIDTVDHRAAELVAELAWGSVVRQKDGIGFWGGFLLNRMRRFARLPLADCTSRLMAELAPNNSSAAQVARLLNSYTREDGAAISAALRQRTDLVHALAFDQMTKLRASRRLIINDE